MRTLACAMAAMAMAAACGPTAAEVRTAKATTYRGDPRAIFQVAEQAAQEEYKLDAVDDVNLQFRTQPKFYSSTGDLESPGAEGFVKMRGGSVEVIFIVQVLPAGQGQVAVRVLPKTFQVVGGSPKPRELAPDDPYLPPFVLGRADTLALRIHDMAGTYVVAPAKT